jgi:lipopolysaccharide biosynthesis glycosyltransferase
MKRAILTINFNNALHANSRASMQASAQRWGAAFWEINETTDWRLPVAPHAYKCAAFARSEFDEILILDADTLVSSRCPNVFENFPGSSLHAVPNGSARFGDLAQVKSAEKYEVDRLMSRDPRFAGLPYHPGTYFNTGVLLVRREFHAAMFALALEVCQVDHGLGWVDQTPLNLAALKCRVPVTLLHERWNYIHPAALGPGWEDLTKQDVYIAHFAGEPGREHVIPNVKW